MATKYISLASWEYRGFGEIANCEITVVMEVMTVVVMW
jgi:hypothetical protein